MLYKNLKIVKITFGVYHILNLVHPVWLDGVAQFPHGAADVSHFDLVLGPLVVRIKGALGGCSKIGENVTLTSVSYNTLQPLLSKKRTISACLSSLSIVTHRAIAQVIYDSNLAEYHFNKGASPILKSIEMPKEEEGRSPDMSRPLNYRHAQNVPSITTGRLMHVL